LTVLNLSLFLVAGASAAPRLGVAASGPVATRCNSAERILYACKIKAVTVSMCATGNSISYRSGAPGRTDLEITSRAADALAHFGTLRGPGRGGQQTSVRFSNKGYEYVVYASIDGTGAARPGRRRSGVAVMKGDREVANLRCLQQGPQQSFDLEGIPQFVREETRPEYLDWF
jgi:hypothetical protein